MKNTLFENLKTKLNGYITRVHKVILKTKVILEARNYGRKNLPANSDSSIEPFLSTIRGTYDELKKEISVSLQGGIQKVLGIVNLTTCNLKIARKSDEIRSERDRETQLTNDRDRIHLTHNQKGYQWAKFVNFLFALGEIVWTTGAFLMLGDIVLIAFLISALIGLAQVWAIKTQTLMIKEIEENKKRWKRIIFTAGVSIVFSVILGLIRYWYVHKSADGANIPFFIINPFTFAAINLLFIVSTGLVVYFFYPSKEELESINEVKKINAEIKNIKTTIEALEGQLYELENQREALSTLRLIIEHAETVLLQRIDRLYDEAVGTFKHENIVVRQDNLFPVCFSKPHDPLPKTSGDNLLFT